MTNRLISLGGLAALGLLLSACGSTPTQPPKSLQDKLTDKGWVLGDKVDEIDNYRVDGWNYLDEEHVIFSAGPSRDYVVSLMSPCQNLRSANAIAFTSTGTRVTTLDKVVVRGTGFTDQCPITALNKITRAPKPKAE